MKITRCVHLLLGIAGLALLISACSATTSPTSTGTPDQPAGSRFDFEGVSFRLDPAVAASASGQIIPENPGSPDGPYWESHPQYVSIAVEGYPLEGANTKPVIAVYPVEDYRRLSPEAGSTLDNLQEFLAEKPAAAGQIPSLPVMNAGQVFQANVNFLDFQNGSGVRFLTVYSQAADPITNQGLVYNFQGLTADGRQAVSIFLPVSHPSLPADPNALSAGDVEAIYKDYGKYLSDLVNALSAQPAGSYTPDLEKLDALIETLTID